MGVDGELRERERVRRDAGAENRFALDRLIPVQLVQQILGRRERRRHRGHQTVRRLVDPGRVGRIVRADAPRRLDVHLRGLRCGRERDEEREGEREHDGTPEREEAGRDGGDGCDGGHEEGCVRDPERVLQAGDGEQELASPT